ncbi:MAG: GNAT family N-acetyltransferase [Tissierellia bacterium]|nr:GNAT family N-acetyltransferase [Tissierellia bacterium]
MAAIVIEGIKIRKILQEDKEEFLAMSTDFYDSEAVLYNVSQEKHLAAFKELMGSSVFIECFIIESIDGIIGYGLINNTYCREAGGPVIWIEEVYVKPAYRGNGIGEYFLKWLEENSPVARYRLEVEPENTEVKSLYRKIGYISFPYVQMIKE